MEQRAAYKQAVGRKGRVLARLIVAQLHGKLRLELPRPLYQDVKVRDDGPRRRLGFQRRGRGGQKSAATWQALGLPLKLGGASPHQCQRGIGQPPDAAVERLPRKKIVLPGNDTKLCLDDCRADAGVRVMATCVDLDRAGARTLSNVRVDSLSESCT